MIKTVAAILAAAAMAAFGDNLVGEEHRAFEVPFKGEGQMGMKFIPVFFPRGTEGAVISFEAKVTDVVRGAQSWFDARMMTKFIDSQCQEVKGGPVIGGWKGTKDWFEVRKSVKVPEGAAGIALMPCLFNVKSGAFELRSLSVVAQEKYEELPEEKAAREERERKRTEQWARRRAKARERLDGTGSIAPAQKEGELYVDLKVKEPGKMVNGYREYDIPEGVKALKMSWQWQVTDLKTGEKPWFDARILYKLKDADGKELKNSPGPSYVQKDTKGWKEKSHSFLVPSNAVQLVVMPCLFMAKSGEMQMKDVKIAETDPQPLLDAAAERERQAKARYVPDEPEKREKWPKMLKVAGNRLVDPDGKEVWLQGVNAGGLETIPSGDQQVKSTVVAIDEWHANCIRLPINEAHWFGRSPYQNDGGESFRRDVDKIVRLAANRGAYVAIDLHRFRAPKPEHVEFWKDCAAHYANHPAVLFDLFNEPHGISWEVWRDGGWVGKQGQHDESAFLTADEKKKNQGFESVGMQALVDAVRSAGAKNVVIAGGLFWANDLTGIESEAIEKGEKPSYRLSDPEGNGIMYAWHTYHWHPGWARILPVAAKHPIFLGEVGASPLGIMNFIPDSQQEDPYTFSPNMLGFIQKYRINWTGWCFHPKAAPVMIENWDYKPTPYWGEFAKRALAGEQFELKRMK